MASETSKQWICLVFKVKSFEKERQTEKRVLESDLVDHVVQKLRTKISDERSIR